MDALGDARLKDKRLGIVAGTPPATYLVSDGLMAKAKPYPLMIDTRYDSSAVAMMNDLASGEIDAGVLWGPMAGYYAARANPPMHVALLMKETGGPRMVYPHHHGCSSVRPELEKAAEQADRREPTRHQQDPARFRRAAA